MYHRGIKQLMHVSDLDNSRNSYWRSILSDIGSRQAFILVLIRWIFGYISLFKKRKKIQYSCIYTFNNAITLPQSGSNNIKPRFKNLSVDWTLI